MAASESPDLVGPALLGVLQGVTEFLPVSSSGHLVLFQQFLDIGGDEVLFDLVLHLGTLLPIVFFYRKSLAAMLTDPVRGEGPLAERDGVRLLALVTIATIPTGLIGVLFEDLFEALFATPAVLAITFAITGAILMYTRTRDSGSTTLAGFTWQHALIIGLAQGFAITPGISRSGTTIAVALALGLNRELAARFSFLISVPAILGAVVLRMGDVQLQELPVAQLAVGGLAAMVSGYFALALLVRLVKQGNLSWFAWYCWFAACVAGAIALYQAG